MTITTTLDVLLKTLTRPAALDSAVALEETFASGSDLRIQDLFLLELRNSSPHSIM